MDLVFRSWSNLSDWVRLHGLRRSVFIKSSHRWVTQVSLLIVARRIAHPSKKEIPNVAVGQAQPLADEPEHGGGREAVCGCQQSIRVDTPESCERDGVDKVAAEQTTSTAWHSLPSSGGRAHSLPPPAPPDDNQLAISWDPPERPCSVSDFNSSRSAPLGRPEQE